MPITLTRRQVATTIAALRLWQRTPDAGKVPEQEIVSDAGAIRGQLSAEEIDILIHRININRI